jgi:hypothetical protein
VLAALERERVEYVVFGPVAINLLGLPRATENLDIFIAPDPSNIDRLKTALRSVFTDPSVEEIKAEDLLGEYPAVQYVPPEGSFYVDILTRPGEAFRYGHNLAPAGFRLHQRQSGNTGDAVPNE